MLTALRAVVLIFVLGLFFSNALLQIATILLLPFVILIIAKNFKKQNLLLIEVLIFLLFFSSLFSIYISDNPAIAGKNIIYHSILISLIPFSYLVKEDRLINLKIISAVFTICTLATSTVGIVRFLSGAPRAYGLYSSYYTLASILAFTIPISIALYYYSKGFLKYLLVISTITQIVSLWLTFTRSALIGVILGFITAFTIFLFRIEVSKIIKRRIILASTLIITCSIILLFSTSDSRINPSLILSNPDISSGRNIIYSDAFKVLQSDLKSNMASLIFGHGLESRKILFPNSNYTSWESDYLETLISQGFLGLLLTCLIYFLFFKKLFRSYNRLKHTDLAIFILGLLASGISFWVISFFSSQLVGRISSSQFVIIFSLTLFIERISEKSMN